MSIFNTDFLTTESFLEAMMLLEICRLIINKTISTKKIFFHKRIKDRRNQKRRTRSQWRSANNGKKFDGQNIGIRN